MRARRWPPRCASAVLVRHFQAPRISDYLRITVGTDGQIDRLLSALSDILGSEPATE